MNLRIAAVVLFLLAAFGASAQEGHPFEGTWRGTIGTGESAKAVVMIIDYDGDKLTGMIDPGRNSYRFDDATHDAPNWKIEVATQNRAGEAIAFSAVMHEIGSPRRYMEGTWTQGGQQQPFKVTRE